MTIEIFVPLTKPTAAQLNAIGDSQTTLNAIYQGASIEPLQMESFPLTADLWYIRHSYRWLLYNSTGTLEDPTGTQEPVTLNDPPTGYGTKDLDEIEWLVTGQIYRVTGCEFAYERRDYA